MQSYHKKRLLKLADYVEKKVKDSKFDMSIVREATIDGETADTCELVKATCVSSACCMGHMPNVFPRDISVKSDYDTHLHIIFKGEEDYLSQKEDFDVAEEFFGLSEDEAFWLFSPDKYRYSGTSRKTVVKRIRQFVANNGVCVDPKNKEEVLDFVDHAQDSCFDIEQIISAVVRV